MPDERLFVVAVSALGAFGPKVDALIDAIAECWFQRGRSVVSRDGEDLDSPVVEMGLMEVVCWGQWPRVCGRRQWWGARAAGTPAKLPQATDTVGLLLGCCGVAGNR